MTDACHISNVKKREEIGFFGFRLVELELDFDLARDETMQTEYLRPVESWCRWRRAARSNLPLSTHQRCLLDRGQCI